MTYRAMNDFFKERIKPEFASGYYQSILDKNNFSSNQMSVRNSTVFFRTGSKAGALEGIPANMLMLDE